MSATTVLVVDDDPALCDMVQDALGENGYRVLTAKHGLQALSILDRERPCMMIIDLMMPIMSGWDLIAAVQSNLDLERIPFVVLSAHPDARHTDRFGKAVSMTKPFQIDDLVEVVERHCPA
jgi:DNA-binding response OmpR family regulator